MNAVPLMAAVYLWSAQAVEFDVPGGDAGDTIPQWSQQARLSVLYNTVTVVGVFTQPVHGTFPPMDALRLMLERTELQADQVTETAVAVFEPPHYCHPERGAQAPLPPCVQLPPSKDRITL